MRIRPTLSGIECDSVKLVFPQEWNTPTVVQACRLQKKLELVWQYDSAGRQDLVPQFADVVDHVFIEQCVADLLMKDHIDFFRRSKLGTVNFLERDILQAIRFVDLLLLAR